MIFLPFVWRLSDTYTPSEVYANFWIQILAAGSLPLVFGAPVPSDHSVSADDLVSHILSGRASNAYQTTFGGNGEGKDWPNENNWLSFSKLQVPPFATTGVETDSLLDGV